MSNIPRDPTAGHMPASMQQFVAPATHVLVRAESRSILIDLGAVRSAVFNEPTSEGRAGAILTLNVGGAEIKLYADDPYEELWALLQRRVKLINVKRSDDAPKA